jgi:hypothetical protein
MLNNLQCTSIADSCYKIHLFLTAKLQITPTNDRFLKPKNCCECAGETVEEQWMKVPYDEGLAPHIGLESCVYARKGISEALTGGMRAGLLSCERF